VSASSFKPGPSCLEKEVHSDDESRNRKNNQRGLHWKCIRPFSAAGLEESVQLAIVEHAARAALARNQSGFFLK